MKIIALICLLSLLFAVDASGTIESWSPLGGEYTHLVGHQENAQLDGLIQDEYGVYLGYSNFVNGSSFGVHIRNIIQVPFRGELKFREAYSSTEIYVDGTESNDTKLLGRMMVGPIYRKSMGPKDDIYFSLGPELRLYEMITTNSFGSHYIYLFYLGVGLDLGYKHDMSNFSFIQIGINADYTARAHTGTDIIISPYLGIGFQY